MPEPFFDRLSSAVARLGPLCVGLDPSTALLEAWGLDDDAAGAERLARTVLEAVAPVAAVVKPQVAFYERFGSAGYVVLERVLAAARDLGLLAIGDAKRGDIPSTTDGYARAWLDGTSPLVVDAVTLSPYLGVAALAPAFERAHATGRGVFVVVASSNDEGRGLQTATMGTGGPVESALLAELDATAVELGGDGSSHGLGAVIGAQRDVDGLERFGGPVLIVGMGTQGSTAADAAKVRASVAHGAVCVNVAREVLRAGPDPAKIRDVAAGFNDELR